MDAKNERLVKLSQFTMTILPDRLLNAGFFLLSILVCLLRSEMLAEAKDEAFVCELLITHREGAKSDSVSRGHTGERVTESEGERRAQRDSL